MPAINQGWGGGAARRTPEPPRQQPVPQYVRAPTPATHYTPPARLPSGPLPQQPFHQAVHEAAQRVQHAQAHLPRQPTPYIPRVANPTPAQARAALTIARNSQRQAVGPNAGVARIAQYQRELAADPRQAQYLQTVAHYARALQAHEGPRQNFAEAGALPAPRDAELPLLGLAHIAIPGSAALLSGLKGVLGAITPGLQGATPEASFMRNLLGDVASVGTFPFVGGYKGAEALVQGLGGNTQPAQQLASGVAQGITHGAIGQAVQGNWGGVERAFREHPGISALEALAPVSAAGRAAGAVARGAGGTAEQGLLRSALGRAGSTVRPPVALTTDAGAARQGLVRQRTYSKDLTRKAAQVAADRRREPLLDANGNPVTYVDRGRTVPVLKPTGLQQEKFQQRRANLESSRATAVERDARQTAEQELLAGATRPGRLPQAVRATATPVIGKRLSPVRVQGELAPISAQTLAEHLAQLVTSGTIRTGELLKPDLEKRIGRIEAAIENPELFRTEGSRVRPGELQTARSNVALLRAAASHPKVLAQAEHIAQEGIAHARSLNAADMHLDALGVYPAGRLERARLSEYALAHMDAIHTTDPAASGMEQASLRHADGRFLSNEEIRAHAQAHGRDPDTLAYLPHRIGTERARSYHKQFRPGTRLAGNDLARTGALYHRGATAISSQLVKDELTNKLTTIASVQQHDKLIHESGLRHPAVEKQRAGKQLTREERAIVEKGGYFTGKEGLEAASRLSHDSGTQYLPMRAFAAKLPLETREAVQEAQSPAAMETAHSSLLDARFVRAGDVSNARNVVLMPLHQITQIQRQLRPAGELEKFAQILNAPFRMAVLPQPRWLTGNFLEPFFVRLPLSGSGANLPGLALDLRAGAKGVKALERGTAAEKQAATEIRSLGFEGLFVGRKGASVRRTYGDFTGNTQRALYGAHVVRNLPVLKQMGDLILTIPHVFFHVNRLIESTAQRAAFGKQLRNDIQEFTGSWLQTVTLGKRAVAEASKGLVDTPTQHRFMERQYELLGQYDGFSPALRRAIQGPMPFLPWTLASLRFVYWTVPAHHTVAFDLLVKAAQSVMPEWEAEHAEAPPGTLRYAPRTKAGGYVDVARYTPFGITIPTSEGLAEAGRQLTNTFLPQASGALKALEGRDPFGRELQVPKTDTNKGKASEGQKAEIAGYSLLEALVPLIAQARRVQEKGGTGYSSSTVWDPQVKPETSHMSALRRTFDPFRPTYLKAPKGGGGRQSLMSEALRSGPARAAEPSLLREALGR